MASENDTSPTCAHPGCKNKIDREEDFCCGCEEWVCEAHSINPVMGHGHDVIEHWDEEFAD